MTHYIAAYAPVNGVRVQAICSRYVFYSDHALAPTCPDCHALIVEEEQHDAEAEAALDALRNMPETPQPSFPIFDPLAGYRLKGVR